MHAQLKNIAISKTHGYETSLFECSRKPLLDFVFCFTVKNENPLVEFYIKKIPMSTLMHLIHTIRSKRPQPMSSKDVLPLAAGRN
jgi:hypothetical protein